jgi:protein-S-isoprenylcysteine O-methyltransferase Ste14
METDPARLKSADRETAGAIARPILFVPATLAAGLILDSLLPLPFAIPEIGRLRWLAAGFLILLGVALFAAGVRNFSKAGTPLPTNQPARVLVTTGIHRWSRNPVYLGFLLIYVGIGVATQSPWVLLLALPLALVIQYGVVAPEEAYLERRFGDAYQEYKRRVRRWL